MREFTSADAPGACGKVGSIPVTSFEGKTPMIGEGCWVHPSADVIGEVPLGARCWIGPGARLRGDYGNIVFGDCCAVEDNCVVHNVARLGDCAVVGMGAIVSDWVELGEWSVIAEGAVVPQRAVVPAGRIAAGVPAPLLDRAVDDE